jgi:hypothetical protein
VRWKPLNILIEKLRIGYLFRRAYGAYCNQRYPDYDLFNALALKSGLPGSDVFKFTTDGAEVTLWPMGQHLDQHGNDEIVDLGSLRWDFEKPDGKINWIAKFRLYEAKYLTEFVKEGPVRIHYLPEARRLAIGGGRNRLLALMRLGYRNAVRRHRHQLSRQASLGRHSPRYLKARLGGQDQEVGGRLEAGIEAHLEGCLRSGLSSWITGIAGVLKLLFAISLIAGVWIPELTKPPGNRPGRVDAGRCRNACQGKGSTQEVLACFDYARPLHHRRRRLGGR